MIPERTYLHQAVKLLADDNLVWSSDFEQLRPVLLDVLQNEKETLVPRLDLVRLAKEIVRAN